MKLKKLIILAICIVGAVVFGVIEYTFFNTKSSNSFEDVIVSSRYIQKGEEITEDKLSVVRVEKGAKIAGAKKKEEVLKKYATVNFYEGETFIAGKLTNEKIDIPKEDDVFIVVKIDPLPNGFITPGSMADLICYDAKTHENIGKFENIKIRDIYNKNGENQNTASRDKNQYNDTGVYQVLIAVNKDYADKILKDMRMGTFYIEKRS